MKHVKHIDVFKCVECNQHKPGTEVGSTCEYPLANPPRIEVTCRACKQGHAKHTPGPWAYSPISNGFRIDSAGFGFICSVQDESDARLIAAAPDLLWLLEDMLTSGAIIDEYKQDVRELIDRAGERPR